MMENKFMGANFQLANKKGDIVFEMKRKEPLRPDGTKDCYYIFQIHREHMTEEEALEFDKVFNEKILPSAKLMNIGMFAYTEIAERANEQMKKQHDAGNTLGEEQVDVSIEIFNYATEEVGKLVVGLSTKQIKDEADD